MPRYAAFLRGVSPMNLKMPALKASFEGAGFTDVKTLLSSGNVVFTASRAAPGTLAKKAEQAMQKELGKSFMTFVRPIDELAAILERDPYTAFKLAAGSKRVVTFFHQAPAKKPKLPVELDGARILASDGAEAFSAYVPGPRGPVFMQLLEKTFGKDITTRTWDTIKKVVKAGS